MLASEAAPALIAESPPPLLLSPSVHYQHHGSLCIGGLTGFASDGVALSALMKAGFRVRYGDILSCYRMLAVCLTVARDTVEYIFDTNDSII